MCTWKDTTRKLPDFPSERARFALGWGNIRRLHKREMKLQEENRASSRLLSSIRFICLPVSLFTVGKAWKDLYTKMLTVRCELGGELDFGLVSILDTAVLLENSTANIKKII